MVKDNALKRGLGRGNAQSRHNQKDVDAHEPSKRNMFYAVRVGRSRRSPFMWSHVRCKYSQILYILLYPGSTLSYVAPFLSLTFDI